MRHIVLVLAILTAVSFGTAFGQGAPPYYSVGGFGSVVNPGLGHPPTLPFGAATGTGPLFPTMLGANIAGHPFGFSGGPGGGRFDHGGPHNRTVIVPYPIYYGGYGAGYGYGYDAQPQQPVDQYGNPIVNTNSAPSVVINQNFAPDRPAPVVREYGAPGPDGVEQQSSSGMKLYQVPPSHPYADAQEAQPQTRSQRRAANDDEPTVYLIAFRDHSIVQALGYWMEGSTLHYVSVEHSLNQASLDLIDRSLSERLNGERGVEFKLPK